MRTYSGPFLTEEGFIQGEITVEDIAGEHRSKIIDFEEGGDSGQEVIIIPTLFNAHAHTGDSIVKSPPAGTIAELVGPGGYKHQILESTDEDDLISAMKHYLQKTRNFGVGDLIDFREGGLDGLKIIRKAAEGMKGKLNINVFARPSTSEYDEKELKNILSLSDGIGISAFRDWDVDELKTVAETVHSMKKPLALHCSEDVREPLEDVLDLDVHHLVHMIEATDEDITTCASENIPIVVCPRANDFFGKNPDITNMIERGVDLCLGTDNAMLASPDMFKEMQTAYGISDVEPLDILMAATWNPRKALNPPSYINSRFSNSYLVLAKKNKKTAYEVVTKTSSNDILKIVEW